MPISPGSSWGEPIGSVSDVERFNDSYKLAQHVLENGPGLYSAGSSPDLLAAIGGTTSLPTQYVWDLGVVTLDSGVRFGFTSWVSLGRPYRRGSQVVLNIPFYSGDRLSLRSHPNNGSLEAFEFDLGLRHRRQFVDRLKSGAHLPHPSVRSKRFRAENIDLSAPQEVIVDGVSVGKAKSVSFEVIQDAFTYVAGTNF